MINKPKNEIESELLAKQKGFKSYTEYQKYIKKMIAEDIEKQKIQENLKKRKIQENLKKYHKCHTKFNISTIEKMNELVKKTVIDKIEYGGSFCMNKESKTNLRNICKGDNCSVLIKKDGCNIEEIRIGEFHTHPHHPHLEKNQFREGPSGKDWNKWLVNDYLLTCIGMAKTKITMCYQKKRDLTPDESNYLRWMARKMDQLEYMIGTSKFSDSGYDKKSAMKKHDETNKKLEMYYYKFSPGKCI